jgi:hypothetical protein
MALFHAYTSAHKNSETWTLADHDERSAQMQKQRQQVLCKSHLAVGKPWGDERANQLKNFLAYPRHAPKVPGTTAGSEQWFEMLNTCEENMLLETRM